MRKETKIAAGVSALLALYLAVCAVAFYQLGTKLAGSLLLASPAVMVAAVFLARGSIRMKDKASTTGRLVQQRTEAFARQIHMTQEQVRQAKLHLAPWLPKIPPLTDVFEPLGPRAALLESGASASTIARRLSSLELAHIEMARTRLEAHQSLMAASLQEGIVGAVAEWTPAMQALHAKGLTGTPPTAVSVGPGDARAFLERVEAVARQAEEALAQHILKAAQLFGEAQHEAELHAQARTRLQAGETPEALIELSRLADLLEGRLEDHVAEHRKAMSSVMVALYDGRQNQYLASHQMERLESVRAALVAAPSALQFEELDRIRAPLVTLAGEALGALLQHVETFDPQAVADYRAIHSTPLAQPTDIADMETFAGEWQARFAALALSLETRRRDDSMQQLYTRLEPKIHSLLTSQVAVSADDLNLRDEMSLKWLVEQNSAWRLYRGKIALAKQTGGDLAAT